MKTFGGNVLFLDRSDINTDEIIPAKYLTAVNKDDLKPHCLEDLKLAGFSAADIEKKDQRVLISRGNFGCGSSREHAPWALEVNHITVVIAESYARIFRQNMFNGGMLAIELAPEVIADIFTLAQTNSVACVVNLDAKKLIFSVNSKPAKEIAFTLSEFDEALVRAGGWVEFADAKY